LPSGQWPSDARQRKREEHNVPTIELNGRTYSVDEDGFLEDPNLWSE
jgi:hypothetical protein